MLAAHRLITPPGLISSIKRIISVGGAVGKAGQYIPPPRPGVWSVLAVSTPARLQENAFGTFDTSYRACLQENILRGCD